MSDNHHNGEYPRPLHSREREWIDWILPRERPGYRPYRDLVEQMVVLGKGRRGEGELILGHPGSQPDFSSPLAPLFAYGAIETAGGLVSISLREFRDDQISVEIVSQGSEEIPADIEERGRWTYSRWAPGEVCPQCRRGVREVPMHTTEAKSGGGGVGEANPGGSESGQLVLALCSPDRRVWVYESSMGLIRLIPVTNFYNELMLHKNIRDPRVALESRRLFSDLPQYSDSDLTYAFLTYNKLKTKVRITGMIEPARKEQWRLANGFRRLFAKK